MSTYIIFTSLLSIAVNLRRDYGILYNRVISISLVLISIILFQTLNIEIENGIRIFNGLFKVNANILSFQLLIFMISTVILCITSFYSKKILTSSHLYNPSLFYNKLPAMPALPANEDYKINKLNTSNPEVTKYVNNELLDFITDKRHNQYKISEYSLIILFICMGSNILISSNDLVSIFLSIELQSYGLYLLCALYRDSERATSASLTYYLLGGLSSCFILLGAAFIYTNTATTSLDNFFILLNLFDIISSDNYNINFISIENINYSLIILSIGFLFKISAAPFHFWSPDVYDAIPTVVTTFVAIIAKISILTFLLELVHYSTNNFNTLNWNIVLLYSAILSLIVGTVLGLNQSRIKRLYAYSTISHLGFILLALSINTVESTQAFMFYLMQYSISNLNAFIILLAVGYSLVFFYKDKSIPEFADIKNSPVQLISQLKGYFYVNPILAISFAITIYSFVGIPPLVGFFGKQMVLSAAISEGYVFVSFIAILASVISAVYYLSIIKQIFFEEGKTGKFEFVKNEKMNEKIVQRNNNLNSYISLSSNLTIGISSITMIITLFIFNPNEWLSLTNILTLILFNA